MLGALGGGAAEIGRYSGGGITGDGGMGSKVGAAGGAAGGASSSAMMRRMEANISSI